MGNGKKFFPQMGICDFECALPDRLRARGCLTHNARAMDTFDYIIVGAGSAGCVLANRLTESGRNSVCLLEAGGLDKDFKIRVPAAFCQLFRTENDWAYETEPQAHADNRRMFWPRGKVIGGCSAINAMIYIRGNRLDYDRWRELGCPGWGYDDVLPYFKKSENQSRHSLAHHGPSGNLFVNDLIEPNILSKTFVDACGELGVPQNDDFNGASQIGAGLYQVTQRNGQRNSAANAFLEPALRRDNIQVIAMAHALRLVFDNTRVTGVVYGHPRSQQKEQTVLARKQVILCGGAVNTPQLLMLSGIGPKAHLASLGIDCVADLPGVGQNLQDHLVAPIAYHCKEPVSIGKADNLFNLLRFFLMKRGPFTSNVAEAGAFVRFDGTVNVPDFQIHFGPAIFLKHGADAPKIHGFTIGPTLIYPKSRGEITLKNANAFDAPAIQPNYFSESVDLDVMVDAFRFCRKIIQADAFAPYRGTERNPGADVQLTDEIKAYLRTMSETIYHPVGTCKMGVDPMAVVSPRLSVHGIQGLRVADASIMPEIVGGNTNAPCIMIGEKAADIIREDDEDLR